QAWSQVGSQQPVFFAVHQVAHDWWKNSPTRTMWARSYWMDDLGDDRDAILRKETNCVSACKFDPMRRGIGVQL
ncbi:hypothetical protein ACC839_38725, partial [Rhizobium ruizarguesonis]